MSTPPTGFPGWQPPPRKSWPRRHKIWSAILTTVGVLVVIGIVGAIFSPGKSTPTVSTSGLPAATSSSPAPSPTPTLTGPQAKFVASLRASLAAHGSANTGTDAELAAVGGQVCSSLKAGAPQSTIISASKGVRSTFDMSPHTFVLLAERDLCKQFLPKVLIRFSGSGIQNSAPFDVPSGTVTVHYSYGNCSGGSGNFIADLTDGSDDQQIANALGSHGHQTTTLYPTDTPGSYRLQVDGECSFHLVLISG